MPLVLQAILGMGEKDRRKLQEYNDVCTFLQSGEFTASSVFDLALHIKGEPS